MRQGFNDIFYKKAFLIEKKNVVENFNLIKIICINSAFITAVYKLDLLNDRGFRGRKRNISH